MNKPLILREERRYTMLLPAVDLQLVQYKYMHLFNNFLLRSFYKSRFSMHNIKRCYNDNSGLV